MKTSNGEVITMSEGTAATQTAIETGARRVNFYLSARAAEEVKRISEEWKLSLSQVFRFALTLAKIYFDETRQKNRIAIVSADGKLLREIIIPLI